MQNDNSQVVVSSKYRQGQRDQPICKNSVKGSKHIKLLPSSPAAATSSPTSSIREMTRSCCCFKPRLFCCCFGSPNWIRKFKKETSNESGSTAKVKSVADHSTKPKPSANQLNEPSRTHRLSNLQMSSQTDSSESTTEYLLPPQSPLYFGRNSLVIDLDETLVHSTFEPVAFADFTVPVTTDDETHEIFVTKRPYVDVFLERMADLFECILFTASLKKYADLVADKLSLTPVFQLRLFREACVFREGTYVKDLSLLGRSISKLAILDNSPSCYSLHRRNAIPVNSWFDDPNDTELLDILPYMEKIAAAADIRVIISCCSS